MCDSARYEIEALRPLRNRSFGLIAKCWFQHTSRAGGPVAKREPSPEGLGPLREEFERHRRATKWWCGSSVRRLPFRDECRASGARDPSCLLPSPSGLGSRLAFEPPAPGSLTMMRFSTRSIATRQLQPELMTSRWNPDKIANLSRRPLGIDPAGIPRRASLIPKKILGSSGSGRDSRV
jgi:hypothetical protein